MFHIGVAGVETATGISNIISAFTVLHRLAKDKQFKLCLNKTGLSLSLTKQILKSGIPSAVQGAVFCFANIFVQASINTFGETAIAGSTIAMNFEYFTYYVITAFGQTATTFTSQNFAARQKARCKKIFWLCLLLSAVCSSVLIFAVVLFRNFFAGIFSHEQMVIESAALRILCILLFEPICNLYEIPAGVLRGSGRAVYPAVCTMIGTYVFRIVWICTMFEKYQTLSVLYYAFPLSWVVNVLLMCTGFIIMRRSLY